MVAVSLQETTAKAKNKNSRGKLMSSGVAQFLTSPEFRQAIRTDEEVVRAKLDVKVKWGKKSVIMKPKKAWRARYVAEKSRGERIS